MENKERSSENKLIRLSQMPDEQGNAKIYQ
jgi:hypothetical protein